VYVKVRKREEQKRGKSDERESEREKREASFNGYPAIRLQKRGLAN
jgi:hypothetical protein